MDFNRAITMLDIYRRNKEPAFLWGEPGVGKSDMVRQLARQLGGLTTPLPIIDFRAILRDPVDLRGLPAIDLENNVARWLPPSDLPHEIRHGKEGILFLDELNAAPGSVQAACFGLVLDRVIGEYELPDGWDIIAAGNPQGNGSAGQRMLKPLANRFAHVFVEHSVESTVLHGLKTGKIDPMILGFLKFRGAEFLHNTNTEEPAFPTPRSWEKFSKVYNDLKKMGQDQDYTLDAAEGMVGKKAAAELTGFLRTFNDLPSFDDIMRDPSNAKLPNEPSGRFAATAMLAAKCTPKQMAPADAYLRRVGEEFRGMFMFDIIKREKDTFEKTETFIEWAVSKNHSSNARF